MKYIFIVIFIVIFISGCGKRTDIDVVDSSSVQEMEYIGEVQATCAKFRNKTWPNPANNKLICKENNAN